MFENRSNAVLQQLLDMIELPEGAYERADNRYNDLGEWLNRPDSECAVYEPHVFSQGSFRLGTAIKPEENEHYDLDISCSLRSGLSKQIVTQQQLKALVGRDLEAYRTARGIKEELDEKNRCWRLDYADDLSFHMDIVPSIPESDIRRGVLKSRMVEASHLDEELAGDVAGFAVSITDMSDEGVYGVISDDWRISNPEGYAKWFESRMRTAQAYLAEREIVCKASIDHLPYHQWKTPLQQAIQLLKRHRDTVFTENREDSKPISIIITTLAAQAYNGEGDLAAALTAILATMDRFVNPTLPRVPNPVNPDEDFADKWYSDEHTHLNLENSFRGWVYQARGDFEAICSQDDSQRIVEAVDSGLGLSLDKTTIDRALGLSAAVVTKPATAIDASDPRPWYRS